jgi:hypothetical protein
LVVDLVFCFLTFFFYKILIFEGILFYIFVVRVWWGE